MEKIKISSKNLKIIIEKVAGLIQQGRVIVCPTDTVYGLIADVQNKDAVEKVFKIKKRRPQKPLPVFVKNLEMTKSLAHINKSQEKFLKKIWPGKITVILKAKTKDFPRGIVSKDKKIGLRVPKYDFLNALLEKVNCPLTGTSANISGEPASTKIKEVLKQFKNQLSTKNGGVQPDIFLDAGDLKFSSSSTVIDLIDFKILRRGEFPKKKLEKLIDIL